MRGKATRGKGEGAIFQRANGLWVARIELPPKPDGTRRRKEITARTKDLLQAKLAEPRRQFYLQGDLPSSTQTVDEWMTYWLDRIAAKRSRPNTLAGYRSVSKQITAAIGRIRLDKLKPFHVRRVHDHILNAGGSSTYALNAHAVLRKALTDAMREGIISQNVATLTDPPRKAVVPQDALTVQEAIAVLARAIPELDGATAVYNPAPARWAAYLLTGMRRGELLGLEWDRVTDVIDLSWQLQRITDMSTAPADYEYRPLKSTMYWTRPKSNAGWRIIPLVEPLRTILEKHRERSEPNAYGLVFTIGGEPIDPDGETDAWPAWLAASGITDTRVKLHGLRHTTVDLLYEAGVPEDVISEIVGHSVRTVTRGYKSRGNLTRRVEGMRQLSAFVGYEPGADRL